MQAAPHLFCRLGALQLLKDQGRRDFDLALLEHSPQLVGGGLRVLSDQLTYYLSPVEIVFKLDVLPGTDLLRRNGIVPRRLVDVLDGLRSHDLLTIEPARQ